MWYDILRIKVLPYHDEVNKILASFFNGKQHGNDSIMNLNAGT